MKKLFFIFLFIIIIVGGIIVYLNFFTIKISPIFILPSNTMIIAECENPLLSWNKFVKNPLWRYFKKNETFKNLDQTISNFDSLINKNKFISKFLLTRNFTISVIHENEVEKTLYIVDLRNIARLFKIEKIIKNLYLKDLQLSFNTLNGYSYYEIYDNKGTLLMSMSIIENLLVFSKDNQFLKKVVKQYKTLKLSKDNDFIEVYDKVKNKGLLKLTINNSVLKKYLEKKLIDKSIYDFINSFSFSTINLLLEKDGSFYFDGLMNFKNDNVKTFYSNFKNIKGGKHTTLEVIPDQFASFALLGIESGEKFFELLRTNNNDIENSITKLEKFLDVDINKTIIDWIDDEICILQTKPSDFGKNNEIAILIKSKNKNEAKNGLDIIKKQVKKKTPLKFNELSYKNYSISYLHIPFLLKVLFGKIFEKIEKPYYTIINDFVVFSNHPQTLLNLIDDYESKKIIMNDEKSNKFLKNFPSKSILLLHIKPNIFIHYLKNYLSPEIYKNVISNKYYFECFSDIGLSAAHDKKFLNVFIYFKFDSSGIVKYNKIKKYEAKNLDTIKTIDSIYIEDEDISMTEQELDVYEDQKIHKEFYDNGNLKLIYKMKRGKRNGLYVEYYEDGKTKIKGKYKDDLKTGEWKYYNENGELIEKKYFKEGIPIE